MNKQPTRNLIPFDEVINLARLKGVDFGKGDPYNRLRYYIKSGLLPKATRKSFNGLPPSGALPIEAVDQLVAIADKIKEGKSVQTILKDQRNGNLEETRPPIEVETNSPTSASIPPTVADFPPQTQNSEPDITSNYIDEVSATKESFGNNLPALAVLNLNPTRLVDYLNHLHPLKLTLVNSALGVILFTLILLISITLTSQRVSEDIASRGLNEANNLPTIAQDGETLGTVIQDGLLSINVNTNISGLLTAAGGVKTENADIDAGTGKLTASNVIYSINAGPNISITGGQNPTISASGGSAPTGTTNRITVSGSQIDIASNYAGQTSITTLGTITTGTWVAGILSDSYVSDTLTINSSSSVDWLALNNYPTGCAPTDFVRAIGTTLTCATDQTGAGAPITIAENDTGVKLVDIVDFQTPDFDVVDALEANEVNIFLGNTGVTAASYGSASSVATFTVDVKGRLTAAASASISINANQITSGSITDAQVSDTLTASSFVGSGSTTTAVDLATTEVAGTLPASSVGNGLTDAQVSDTLTSSLFVGSGSTTTAIDLATAEVAGTLGVGNGGTGATTFTTNGVLYGNGASAIGATAAGTAGDCLKSNGAGSPPSYSSCGAIAGGITVRETDAAPSYNGIQILEFGPSSASEDELIVTNPGAGTVARIEIGAQIARRNVAQAFSGTLTLNDNDGTSDDVNLILGDANESGTITTNNGAINAGTGTGTFGDISCGSTTCITLGAETGGNYVASTNTSVLTGLTGGNAGSEGATLTIGLDYSQALSGDVALAANAAVFGQSGIVFEGSAADLIETYFAVTNPTGSDRTITIPDNSGTVCLTGVACDATTGDSATGFFTSGTLEVARGGTGTGTTPTNGQLLIGNGSGYAVANITGSNSLLVSNGAGTISLDTTLHSTGPGLEKTNGLSLIRTCANNEILKWNLGATTWGCAADAGSGGPSTLQSAYDAGATIETASNIAALITETTAAANTGDLLQLTSNAATGGTHSGDLIQLTLDAADANGFTGNGIHLVVDTSQTSSASNLLLFEDDAGTPNTIFKVAEDGVVTVGNGTATGAITPSGLTGTRTFTLPDSDGTFATSGNLNNGLEFASNVFNVRLASAKTGVSTASNSGLEFVSQGLSLIQGCADNELLKWTDAGGWACAADSGSGSGGGGQNLQDTYVVGNTLSVLSGEGNLAFTLTSADFTVTTPDNGTNFTTFARADGTGTADPAQLLLIDNLDIDRAQPIGLKIQSAAGNLTTAIDLSDPEIVNALNLGANDIIASGSLTFDFSGAASDSTLTLQNSSDTAANDRIVALKIDTEADASDKKLLIIESGVGGADNEKASIDSDGDLSLDGIITLAGGATTDLISASGANLTISAGGTGDIRFTTDADTDFVLTAAGFANCSALETVSNVLTCGSDNVGTSSLQSEYEAGNTITLNDTGLDLTFITDEVATVHNFFVNRGGGGTYLATDATNDELELGSTSGGTVSVVSLGNFSTVGTTTLGDAAADSITLTGSINSNVNFLDADGTNYEIEGADAGTATGNAGNLTIGAGDGGGTSGNGGNLVLQGGTVASGTAGYIALETAGSERLRITNTGTFLFEKGANDLTLVVTAPGAAVNATIPALSVSDDFVFEDLAQTLTNKSISGASNTLSNIGNASLTNSSITFAGDSGSSATSLGGTRTIAGGTGVTTAEAAGTVTVTANTASGVTTSGDNIVLDQAFSPTWTGLHTFTPSGSNDTVFNGDDDSNLQINSTIAADSTINPISITITDNAAASTGTIYGINLTNADNGVNTGVIDALARLNNANAAETTPRGLYIEQTGAGTLTSAIEIAETAGTITDGITITGTLGNILNSGSIDITGAGALTGATGITSSGTITFSGLSTDGGVVYADNSGILGQTTAGSTGECLLSGGAGNPPAYGSCGAGAGGIGVTDDFGTSLGSKTTLNFNTFFDVADGGGGNAEITLQPDSIDFTELQDTLDLDANTNINADDNVSQFGLTITSDLAVAGRSTDVLTITQANHATNNSTGNLLQLTNSDTASTAALIALSNASTAANTNYIEFESQITTNQAAIEFTQNADLQGTGIKFDVTANITGTAIDIAGGVTTGTGINIAASNNTTGVGIVIAGAASGAISAFSTGDYIRVNPTRTLTSGSIDDSGNFLQLTRANTVNNVASTFTISGDLATLSSSCTQTAGTCTDTANILELNQQYASASGAVLNILNAGSGSGILFEQGTTVVDGISWGTDVNTVSLYRSANNELKTDDSFSAGDSLFVAGGPIKLTNTSFTGDATRTPFVQFDSCGSTPGGIAFDRNSSQDRFYFAVCGTPQVNLLTAGHATGEQGGTIGNQIVIPGTLANINGSDVYKALFINIDTTANHSGVSNSATFIDIAGPDGDDQLALTGINIGALTNAGASAETAINIGTGWDYDIFSTANIDLGGTATGTSATQLVLPIKTDSGDPTTTQANGGIYYNSNSGKFRCYENSVWKDCDTNSGASLTLQNAYDNGAAGNQIITLDGTQDSIIIRNPSATAGTDSAFTLQVDNIDTGVTTADFKNLNVTSAGSFDTTAGNLTNYAGYFNNTSTESAGTNTLVNVGLYASASGADNNYAAIFENGNVGIGITNPSVRLDVNTSITSTTGGIQFRNIATFAPGSAPTSGDFQSAFIRALASANSFNSTSVVTGTHSEVSGNAAITVDWARAFESFGDRSFSTPTFTNYAGYYAKNPTNPSLTVTNQYGVYIENLTKGASDYGVYIAGADTAEIALPAAAPKVIVGNGTTGALSFTDGTNTLCTITDAGTTGNLSCTGNITGASTGTVGYWTRGSGTLSPATAGDVITLGTLDNGDTGLSATLPGSSTGTNNGVSITTSSVSSGTQNAFIANIVGTSAGTTNGLNVNPSGTFANTVNGIRIGGVTDSTATSTGLNISAGWDTGVSVELADAGSPIGFSVVHQGIYTTASTITGVNIADISEIVGQSSAINVGTGWDTILAGNLGALSGVSKKGVDITIGTTTTSGTQTAFSATLGLAGGGTTQKGLLITPNAGNGGGDNYGIDIGSIGNAAGTNDTAIRIATGWDSAIKITSNTSTTTSGVIDIDVDSVTAGNSGINLAYTANGAASGTQVGFDLTLTNNDTAQAAEIYYAQRITNANNAGANITNALINLDQADNTASGITSGILFTDTGTGTFDSGIDFSQASAFGNAAIELGNHTIIGGTAVIDFTNFDVATTGNITVATTRGLDTNSGSGTLNIGTTNASTALNLGVGGATAVSVVIAGGSGATGCTVAGNTGALTCSGAITTTASTGNQGWWSRTVPGGGNPNYLRPITSLDAIYTDGHGALGNLSFPSNTSALQVYEDDGVTTSIRNGIQAYLTKLGNNILGSSANFRAIDALIDVNALGGNFTGIITSVYAGVSTDDLTNLGGSVTWTRGFETVFTQDDPSAFAGGTLTNNAGLYVRNPDLDGGDGADNGGDRPITLTNNYGIYLENQTAGTNDYGLYLAGADTADIFFETDRNHTIKVQDQDTAATAGSDLSILGATGNTSGTGGGITLTAGNGGTSGQGGAINLNGGTGFAAGNGGGITLTAGTSATSNAGFVTLQGGGTTSGTAGTVQILGGNSTTTNGFGGDITITAGKGYNITNGPGIVTITGGISGANVAAGSVNLVGGAPDNGTTGVAGGAVNITGGAGATHGAGSGVGGAVNITGGAAGTAGSGSINGGGINITSGAAGAGSGAASGNIVITTPGAASKSSGDINISTGANASGTNAGDINIQAGSINGGINNDGNINLVTNSSGQITFFSQQDAPDTSAAFVFEANSLFSGSDGVYIFNSGASTLTSGNLVNIASTFNSGASTAATSLKLDTTNSTSGAGGFTGIDLSNITGSGTGTGAKNGIKIGTGWTTALDITGTTTANITTKAVNISGYSHTQTGSQTQTLVDLAYSFAVTSVGGNSPISNGILLSPTINSSSGNSDKTANSINIAPTFTACTAGNCFVRGLNISNVTDGANFHTTAIALGTGWDNSITGIGATVDIASNLTTGTAVAVNSGLGITLTGSYTGFNVDLNTNYTPGSNNRTGISISSVTSGGSSENALQIGTGWDNDIFFLTDATHIIKVQDQDTAAVAGSALQILGATGGTGAGVAGAGGALTLSSGVGGDSTNNNGGAGGDITISSGNGGGSAAGVATAGSGGNISITTGTGASHGWLAGNGGNLNVTLGNGGANANFLIGGNGGSFSVTAGSAVLGVGTVAGLGGNVSLTAGSSTVGGTGGAVSLTSGAGGPTGAGGAISFTTGAGGSTSGASGAINLLTGNVTSGTAGSININVGTSTSSQGSILIGTIARNQAITLGNTSNTAPITFNSAVITGTTTSSSFVFRNAALTTGTGIDSAFTFGNSSGSGTAINLAVTNSTSSTAGFAGVNIANLAGSGTGTGTKNAISVGTGWDYSLNASSDILLNSRADTGAAAGSFTKASQSTAGTIASGGTASIDKVTSSAVYNGSLYVGTTESNSAEIYRYNGGTSWTKVSQTTAGTIASGGTASIDGVSAMTVYDGYLYAMTNESNSAQVYRYDGGTTWTLINSTAGQFTTDGTPTTAIDQVSATVVYDGNLYIGTTEGAKNEVYVYKGGTGTNVFAKASGAAGQLGDGTAAIDGVGSLAVANNILYAGTFDCCSNGEVYRYNGGTSWTRVSNSGGTIASGGTANIDVVSALAVYNGKLYIGTSESESAEVYRYDGTAGSANNWTKVSQGTAGTIASGGTAGIDSVSAMSVYNGRLYISTSEDNSTGCTTGCAEVYRYDGGTTWTKVSAATGGTIATSGTANIDGTATLASFDGKLFVGTSESNSAEVYHYTDYEGHSYAIKFRAPSDNAGSTEQSNYLNLASISFLGEQNSLNNNGNTGTGQFLFTHGVTTATGAYDVAEDYPTRDDSLQPGEIVSIDVSERGFVRKTTQGYDDRILGVYSEKPALRLSQIDQSISGGKAIPVALVGRVPVKVSSENGTIKPGDSLTSSSKPGVAMKATAAGTIIGKALEAYNESDPGVVGKISIAVKTGYWSPPLQEQIANASVSLGSLTLANLTISDTLVIADKITLDKNGKFTVNGEVIVVGLIKLTGDLTVSGRIDSKIVAAEEFQVKSKENDDNKTAGVATIPTGTDELIINTNKVVEQSLIFVTPTKSTDKQLAVIEKIAETSFKVKLNGVATEDITFNWLIINQQISQGN